MTYTTPNLLTFEVSWHIDPNNIPRPVSAEFLAERFIEDVLDATQGARPSFTIVETRIPDEVRLVDTLVEIVFHITASIQDGKVLQAYDFEIEPLTPCHPEWDYRCSPHDGMTWGELRDLIHRSIGSGDIKAEEIASATDDNDPNAPWVVLTGMVKGDNGWHLTTEEFRP